MLARNGIPQSALPVSKPYHPHRRCEVASIFISNHCACVHVAVQHLSTLPPKEWADSVIEGGKPETQPMKELIQLKTAFAHARRLLREMGEVQRKYCNR